MFDTPRLDRRKARIAARGAEEPRKHRRVVLPLDGRFLCHDNVERACCVRDLSPGGARLEAEHRPPPGALTVVHLDQFGHLEAEVVRTTDEGFSVRWLAGPRRRERLAEQLVWRYNAPRLGLADDRASVRDKRRGVARVMFEDNVEVSAQVVDVSATGICFRSTHRPRVGEAAQMGRLHGEVSRLLRDGFAVCFDPPASDDADQDGAESPAHVA